MVLLNNTQDKNILDELVITKFEILPKLLNLIKLNKGISQNELRKQAQVSGGKIYHSVKALKSMKLVTNGNGLNITELGKRLLEEYISKNKISINVLKEACLNVPLFKKIYESNKNEKQPQTLFKIFKEEIVKEYPNINQRLIGSGVRRYLQGIHNIRLRAGARTGSKNNYKQKHFRELGKALGSIPELKISNCLNTINEKELINAINIFNEIKRLPLERSIKRYGKNITQTVLNNL